MSFGALSLKNGVLYVARCDQTGHVRPYDLDGRPLADGFSFRGLQGAPWTLGGIDVDGDHQIWIGDCAASRVATFSLFGLEIASLQGAERERDDARGALRSVVDVALTGEDDAPQLVVASGGWRRHALQVFEPDGRCVESLRPEGDSHAHFHGISRIAAQGRWLYVCETAAGRVQVFRDREFHFAFRVPVAGGRFEPIAVAALADGRLIVATGGAHSALLLVDSAGRLLRVLAESGSGDAQVVEPVDVVVEQTQPEGKARVAVIDRDAERVQVFSLEGRCHGALDVLPGRAL
jgi:hypothetical protein